MLEALLILAAEPAPLVEVQVPERAVLGELTVHQAHMMGWMSAGRLGGEIAFTVSNAGAEPDRVVSVSSPAGPVERLTLQSATRQGVVSLPNGNRTVAAAASDGPGLTRVTAHLSDLARGEPSSQATAVTIRFERAGEVTVLARPVSPAPSGAR